jgi:hypothetical protein
MAKAGRRRKTGERHRCGKLRETFDHGSERVQAMRGLYGTHYSTALGRAYAAGLLGDPAVALDRYQGGKKFVRVYTRCIGGQAYRCPLDQTPRGSNTIDFEATEQEQRDHDWLHAAMDSLDVAGVRPYLDQLITREHTDQGPAWLDALLRGGKHPADRILLDAAIRALDILAPARRAVGIVSVTS